MSNLIRLHLGSGNKRLPGHMHVDIRPDVNPDIVSDVSRLPMIRTNSVASIYFCHGLEHVKHANVPAVLAEWKRVLIPGGILRLSVPDFEVLCGMYCQRACDLILIRGAICGGQDYPSNIHYSVWDFDLLESVLRQAGYSRVEEYNAMEWLESILGGPVRQGNKRIYFDWSIGQIAGRDISLNVEAVA